MMSPANTEMRNDRVISIVRVAGRRGHGLSEPLVRSVVTLDTSDDQLPARLAELGIASQVIPFGDLDVDFLPALALLSNGDARDIERNSAGGWLDSAGNNIELSPTDRVLVFGRAGAFDDRANAIVDQEERGWFWPVLWRFRRYYYEAAALSAVVNILSLAGIIFMMTVYDRILPNLAFVTLWSLLTGVGLAMVFEFLSRTIRARVLDLAGKKIDLILGDSVFSHILETRLEAKARSSGAYANLLKEFEQVRAFVTSATLVAFADLPFAFLFLGVCALVGGWLVIIPLLAFAIVLTFALLVQRPMARIANENLREASVRHGTIIESLEGIETLKALRIEARMRRRHEQASAVIADRGIVSQGWSNLSMHVTIAAQQAAAALLLVWGVYLASTGMVTAGALMACVQLNSRALAPLVTLSSLAVRYQQVRSALAGLEKIMRLPAERDPSRHLLSNPDWQGSVELKEVSFRYESDGPAALEKVSLRINPGEKVAILGRVGSGKSTLLRILSSLYRPQEGQILLDGVDMSSIEPSEIRSTLLLVGQDARLFHGTLRENLLAAAPMANDTRLLAVSERTGVAAIAGAHPLGFDRPVGERGDTLSGGQRQAVAMARAILSGGKTFLLDEPTSAMDQASEASMLQYLSSLAEDGIGFVVVTHKHALLPLVDRIIVMDAGRIVADGPREALMRALADGQIRSAA